MDTFSPRIYVSGVADDQTFHDVIEGYPQRLSVTAGEDVDLCVSTTAASYDVTVERWGAQRVEVWSARGLAGTAHDLPADADAEGCGWPTTLQIPTDASWRSGFHLVTLTAHDAPASRDRAHACFVVRAGHERARAILVLATNTWHAYNPWGGKSLHTGGTQVSYARPFARSMLDRPEVARDDRKARPVHTHEEPDVDGTIFQRCRLERNYPSAIGSTGWFTHDRRFVEWAEAASFNPGW